MLITNSTFEKQRADELLSDWYHWAMRWRPKLGYPSIAVYCRQSKTSRQYDEDAGYDELQKTEMEAVDDCVNELPIEMQMAIKTEMRNRESKSRVWRDKYSVNYSCTLDNAISIFRKRGLLY